MAEIRVRAFLVGNRWLVQLDKRTYIIGSAAVGAAVLLGALAGKFAGPLAGALTALAGLVSAVLWAGAADRRRALQSLAKVMDDADRALAPPGPVLRESGPSDEQPGGPVERSGGFARYLRPEDAVVSFRQRPELAVLRDWLVSNQRTDVRLVIGEGGAGKTRLAIQLSQEAAAQYGWRCYWVHPGDETRAARAAAGSDIPVLLVVDYAETLTGLAGLLAEATGEGAGPNVRVLLLARSAGEWWDQLIGGSGTSLGEKLATVSPVVLRALSEPSGQDNVFRQALEAFAAKLRMPCPTAARLPPVGPDAVVLVVHAAALLAVLDYRATSHPGDEIADPADVIARLLLHERKYWEQSQARYGLNLGPAVTRRVVAAGTLIGADNEASAARMLAAISDLPDAGVRGRAARWLHDLYPSGEPGAAASEWIAPLRPDLVAENLVVSVLCDQPDLTRVLVTGLAEQRARRVLTLLARAALTDPAATGLLDIALAADLGNLALPALAVAVETNPAVGDQIAEALDAASLPPDLLQRIADALPYPSVALASTAELVYRHLTDASPGNSDERGRNLIALSNRLAALGRREDALAAIEEAVTAYRELARARPDAFLPNLAASLNNQSLGLSELGRREDALDAIEEAVTIRRELARARPDAFLPDLAMSLNNQSLRLSELGRREDALDAIEEAVTAYRELARARPDAFLPDLATSLNNQSGCLSDLGRREDALAAIEEAVTIRRDLARARPAVYLARLTSSLNVMADAISAMGRNAEADAIRAEAARLE